MVDTTAGDVATNCAELPGHRALTVMRTAAAADASWRRSSSEADHTLLDRLCELVQADFASEQLHLMLFSLNTDGDWQMKAGIKGGTSTGNGGNGAGEVKPGALK